MGGSTSYLSGQRINRIISMSNPKSIFTAICIKRNGIENGGAQQNDK
jgi:hypothetical protein